MTAVGSLDGGYSDDTLYRLSNIQKNDVNYVVIESNFGDGMATALLKPVMAKIHPEVEEVRHNIQKKRYHRYFRAYYEWT